MSKALFYVFWVLSFLTLNVYLFSSITFIVPIFLLFLFIAMYSLYKSKKYIHLLFLVLICAVIQIFYSFSVDIDKYNYTFLTDNSNVEDNINNPKNFIEVFNLENDLGNNIISIWSESLEGFNKTTFIENLFRNEYNQTIADIDNYVVTSNLFFSKKQFTEYLQDYYYFAYENIINWTSENILNSKFSGYTWINVLTFISRQRVYRTFSSVDILYNISESLWNIEILLNSESWL